MTNGPGSEPWSAYQDQPGYPSNQPQPGYQTQPSNQTQPGYQPQPDGYQPQYQPQSGYQGPPATQPAPAPAPYAYPPQYPVAQQQGGYPTAYVPGYQVPVGYMPVTYIREPGTPGVTMTSAVLGFITGGLVLILSLFLFWGSSFANAFDENGTATELTLDGVANLLMGGLLIGGGVTVIGGSRTGRGLLLLGSAITFVFAIYWMVRWDYSIGWNPWAVVFLTLTVLIAAFAVSSSTSQHIARKENSTQGQAPAAHR